MSGVIDKMSETFNSICCCCSWWW